MLKELEQRKMSNQEIADWAGISLDYFSRNRAKWCEKNLSRYAKYELYRGYVNILEVIEPLRSPKIKDQVEKNFYKCWGTKEFKADSCKNAIRKIKPLVKPADAVKDTTLYNYVCFTKRKQFGVPKRYSCEHGESKWVYCKIRYEDGVAEDFTPEEQEYRAVLAKKYLRFNEGKLIDLKAAKKAMAEGEISQKDFEIIFDEIADKECGWLSYENDLMDFINQGCDRWHPKYYLDFRTYIEPNVCTYTKEEIEEEFGYKLGEHKQSCSEENKKCFDF